MPESSANQSRAGLVNRIWNSIFTEPLLPKTDQQRRRFLLKNLILHFRPQTVPQRTLKFSLTWGLGGMAAVLVLLQISTGLLLKFIYEPFPVRAYASVLSLQNDVFFGQFIRNIHHWSANLLVLIIFLHLLRIFFTGAFRPPRQFNWIIGLCLFLLVLIANFTGYLLPWDQLAYWAVTICIGMLDYIPAVGLWLQKIIRGGPQIGPATLHNFFTLHTAVLPVCLLLLMAFHFWRVRKAGGLVIPRSTDEDIITRPDHVLTIPNLILREVVVALMLIASVLVISIFFNAPLEEQANPGLSPNPTKAPWYFAGLQELLLHFHPIFAVLVLPLAAFVALLYLPYADDNDNSSGIWFRSHTGRRLAVVSATISMVAVPLLIVIDEYAIDFTTWMPNAASVISNGLIPAILLLAAVVGFYILLKKKFAASKEEAIQSVFVLLLVAFVVLTVTGIWFRGKGMGLIVPW
jgi:quinol-cytochrome oxidoreductase complex cytochrome b subunit